MEEELKKIAEKDSAEAARRESEIPVMPENWEQKHPVIYRREGEIIKSDKKDDNGRFFIVYTDRKNC